MPSCFSTGVKLARRACRCVSREVVAEETRNSVKEEPGASSGGREPGPSSGGGSGGRGAVVVANGRGNVGAAAESEGTCSVEKGGRSGQANRGAGGEDRAAAAALDDNLEQEQRYPRCRRRALQRKDRAGESRSTSTMTVDDDSDGSGEDCAAAGNVHPWRRKKIRLAEIGVEEDRSVTDFATDQRQTCFVDRSSQISHHDILGEKFMAGEISDRYVTIYNLVVDEQAGQREDPQTSKGKGPMIGDSFEDSQSGFSPCLHYKKNVE
ncbi:hypothetical protein Scep_012859 [Stephania cephalantha]|uniref:Uncharacterized protein n=1 Tax=Stephania cephalantha TaxID=152367 RepID=A0AAP0PA86_9MAGN